MSVDLTKTRIEDLSLVDLDFAVREELVDWQTASSEYNRRGLHEHGLQLVVRVFVERLGVAAFIHGEEQLPQSDRYAAPLGPRLREAAKRVAPLLRQLADEVGSPGWVGP